jgi:MFS family permease
LNLRLLERHELKLGATLSGVIAMRMLGLFLILPVFMLLAVDVPGYTPLMAGLAIGIYGLTQALLQQPFGRLSDRLGRRPVMLLGLALFTAGGAAAALADSMLMLVVGRALQGCGAVAGVAMAFAADGTHPTRRPLVMALIGIGIGFSFLLSTVLSVPLANLLGLKGLFWLTCILGVAGIFLVLTLPEDAPRENLLQAGGQFGRIWPLAISVFFLHAVMTLLFVVLPGELLRHHGMELSRHWQVYAPTMLVSTVLVFPLLRRYARSESEGRMLPLAFAGLGVTLALLGARLPLLGLLAVVSAYFLAFNVLEAAMPSVASRMTDSTSRGRQMGLYSTFQFLGAFVGGVTGGWLLGVTGGTFVLLSAGGVCVLWAGVLAIALNRGARVG